MTDNLTSKFTQLEELITTQHGEVIDALNSILVALGSPPVGGGTTLDDVVSAIGTTNNTLSDVLTAIATTNSRLNTVNANLGYSNSYITSIKSDTGELLTLLQDTDFCCGQSNNPALSPPLSGIDVIQDETLCKVAQQAVDTAISLIVYLEQLAASNLELTIDLIAQAFSQEPRLSNCPSISQEELGTLLLAVQGVRDNNITGIEDTIFNTKVTYYSLLYDNLNAQDARLAWDAQIVLDYMGQHERAIATGVLYDGFLNCIYSTPSGLDGAGYDGTVCGEITIDCMTTSSTVVSASPSSGYPNRQQAWFEVFSPVATLELGPGINAVYGEACIMTGSGFVPGRLTSISGRFRVVSGVSGVSMFIDDVPDGDFVAVRDGINYMTIDDFVQPDTGGSGAFTVQWCPPGGD